MEQDRGRGVKVMRMGGGIRVESLIRTHFFACRVDILVYLRMCPYSCLRRRMTRGVASARSYVREAFESGRGSTLMVKKEDIIEPLLGW